LGSADIEAEIGTQPECPVTEEGDPPKNQVQFRSSQLRVVTAAEGGLGSIEGSVELRVPAELLNRVTGGAPSFAGWVSLDGEVRYDAGAKLPLFAGTVRTGEVLLAGKRLSESTVGKVRLANDHILIDHMHVIYGGGPVDIFDVDISPFDMTRAARKVDGRNVWTPPRHRHDLACGQRLLRGARRQTPDACGMGVRGGCQRRSARRGPRPGVHAAVAGNVQHAAAPAAAGRPSRA
jgi:hypothetical protein